MKRDLDLIRRILLAMETDDFAKGIAWTMPGERDSVVAYHVYLLQREHLVDAVDGGATDAKHPWYVPMAVTPAGRGWTDAARDENRWRQFLCDLGARAWSMSLHELKLALAAANPAEKR